MKKEKEITHLTKKPYPAHSRFFKATSKSCGESVAWSLFLGPKLARGPPLARWCILEVNNVVFWGLSGAGSSKTEIPKIIF